MAETIQIPVKYEGSCRVCGARIPVGAMANWDREARAIECVRCLPHHQTAGPSGPATGTPTSPSVRARPIAADHDPALHPPPQPSGPATTTQQVWERFIDYAIASIEADSRLTLANLRMAQAFVPLALQTETLLHGLTPVALPEGLTPDGDFLYGWPVLTLRAAAAGTPLVRMPMLVATVTMTDDRTHLKAVDGEISLNPALLLHGVLAEGEADALEELVTSLAHASPTEVATAVAAFLDFDLPPLDPHRLARYAPSTTEGIVNAAALHLLPSGAAAHSLLKELAELRSCTDWMGTAVEPVVKLVSGWPSATPTGQATSQPHNAPQIIEPIVLNERQRDAVAAIAQRRHVVLTGPPGTGKTQVVTAAAANAWNTGTSLLVVSTNNTAVDNAVDRAAAIQPGLLLRVGKQEVDDRLPLEAGLLRSAAGEFVETNGGQINVAALRARFNQAVVARQRTEADLAARDAASHRLQELQLVLHQQAGTVWTSAFVGMLRDRDKLVRLAAKSRQRGLGGLFVRPLAGFRFRRTCRSAGALDTCTPQQFMAWSETKRANDNSLFELTRLQSADLGPEALVRADAAVTEASAAITSALVHSAFLRPPLTPHGLETFRKDATRARQTAIREALPAVKGWACTTFSLARNFPLAAGLFDSVLIDEATQCTTASMIPALYRARHATVIGDPNQLMPAVSRPMATDLAMAARAGLTEQVMKDTNMLHGESSVWHGVRQAAGADTTIQLDLHYRSHPAVARWFNKTFYGDSLHVVTQAGEAANPERGIHWIDTPGTSATVGGRSLVNQAEADAVLQLVGRLLAAGVTDIGVVTPFAGQAALLSEMLSAHGIEGVVAATAHRFQGGERDTIVMSTVIEPGTARGTANFVEKSRNLVNVAASRAKSAFYVIGNPGIGTHHGAALVSPTLASLRAAAMEQVRPPIQSTNLHSEHEERLFALLLRAGLHPLSKPVVEGYELDFAVVSPAVKLNVEVDGFQHRHFGTQRRRDMARDAALQSVGWTVLRVPTWQLDTNPELVMRMVQERLLPAKAVGGDAGVATDELVHPLALPILVALRQAGNSSPVVGYEAAGADGSYVQQLELAWPAYRVAVMVEPVEPALTLMGWQTVQASDPTALAGVSKLLAKFEARQP